MKDIINYMGYQWLAVDEGVVTVGVNESGVEELTEITAVNLPPVDEEVGPEEICGEIETDSGPLNLYSPVEGTVIEVNEAVVEDPSLILEDPMGDGWLFRLETKDASDLDELTQASSGSDDDEEDDDDLDEDSEDE